MLFMGEEWGARTPWQFFTDHPEPELAAAVREGRRAEFAAHGWAAGDVPDPQDPATFERSRLDWAGQDPAMLAVYRSLIALRKRHPALSDPRLDLVEVTHDDGVLLIRRGPHVVVANLTPTPAPSHCPRTACSSATDDTVVLQADTLTLPPESAAIL